VELDRYLERLRALPALTRVDRVAAPGPADRAVDAVLEVHAGRRRHRLVVEAKGAPLSKIVAAAIPGHAAPTLVVAPSIAGDAARDLEARGLNYLDLAGNCHLVLEPGIYVHIQGQRREPVPAEDRGIRAPGYQVLFAYLAGADPSAPLRLTGEVAGVSRQAVQDMRARLVAEGFLLSGRSGVRWNPRRRDDALRRWLEGYVAMVRPRLFVGSYRTRERTPDDLTAMLVAYAGPPGPRWRWGGAAAGYALRRHYRSERTVVHIADDAPAFAAGLPALRDPRGPLVVLGSFGTINWQHTHGEAIVHPLLAYSELLVGDDERAREAAHDLFEAVLQPGWTS
jgi:hypothetical protein